MHRAALSLVGARDLVSERCVAQNVRVGPTMHVWCMDELVAEKTNGGTRTFMRCVCDDVDKRGVHCCLDAISTTLLFSSAAGDGRIGGVEGDGAYRETATVAASSGSGEGRRNSAGRMCDAVHHHHHDDDASQSACGPTATDGTHAVTDGVHGSANDTLPEALASELPERSPWRYEDPPVLACTLLRGTSSLVFA